MTAGRATTGASAVRTSCSICSTWGLWEAYPTGTSRARTPASWQAWVKPARAAGSPATTVAAGLLTAATVSPGQPARRAVTAAARLGHRGHAAVAVQAQQRPRPQCYHPGRVVEGQDPGHRRGGDLALGVANHRVRGHARGLPESGQ